MTCEKWPRFKEIDTKNQIGESGGERRKPLVQTLHTYRPMYLRVCLVPSIYLSGAGCQNVLMPNRLREFMLGAETSVNPLFVVI